MAQNERFNEAGQRFFEHVANQSDTSLYILKAHLFFEEQLNAIIEQSVKDAEALVPARLTFFQILCVVRSMHGHHLGPQLDLLQELNRIRNKLSHHLAPKDLELSVLEFCDHVVGEAPEDICGHFEEITLIKKLQGVTALLAGMITGFSNGFGAVVAVAAGCDRKDVIGK